MIINKLFTIKYFSSLEEEDVFDICDINIPILKEFNAFREFIRLKEYEKYKYSGIVSPKFRAKTGISKKEALKFISNDFDIILYHPYPLEFEIQSDFLQLAELEHSGLTNSLNKLWNMLYNEDLPKVKLPDNQIFCVHSNFFVANKLFWKEFSKDIIMINNLINSNKVDFLFTKTDYNLTDKKEFSLELFPFVFERYLTHYLYKHRSKFKIKNISLEKKFKPVLLFKYEDLLIRTLSKISNNTIETLLYFYLRKFIFRIKNLKGFNNE